MLGDFTSLPLLYKYRMIKFKTKAAVRCLFLPSSAEGLSGLVYVSRPMSPRL